MDTNISIALNDIQDTRTVNIEGVGVLNIRKLGSGEDLDLSFKQRRFNKLLDELASIDFVGLDATKPSDMKKIKRQSDRAEKIGEEISNIKQSQFEIYKRLLSDDKNGKVVDLIMNTLNDVERAKIFEIAFGKRNVLELDESVNPDEEAE